MRCVWIRMLLFVASLVVGAVGVACVVVSDGPRPRGDLTVGYDFEALGCSDAGVHSVDLNVEGDSGDTASVSVTCDPRYYTFVDLSEDGYNVTVDAYDSGNGLLYGGTFRATVYADAGNEVDVSLPAALGRLTIDWTFEGSTACLDVVNVRVLLRDPFDTVYDDAVYSCGSGGVAYGDVITGNWRVWLHGLSSAGATIYQANNVSAYVDAGADNTFNVDLTP